MRLDGETGAPGGRRGAALALALALGCATPPPAAPAAMEADFDAPRPAAVAALLQASRHRERRGNVAGALAAAEEASTRNPGSAAAALRQAELRAELAARGSDAEALAEARAELDEVLRQHPEHPAPRLVAARLALAGGERAAVAEQARALAAERPDWGAAHALLAEALLDDDPSAALAEAELAVKLAPGDPDALAARARAHAAFAQDNPAVEDARRALRVRPGDVALETVHAASLLRLGNARRAAERAESVLEAERSAPLELVLASARLLLRDPSAARAALARARQRAAGDPVALSDALALGLELDLAEGRSAEALAALEAARRDHPDVPGLDELLARAQLAAGKPGEAQASARRGVERAPERASAWITLALVLGGAGARPPADARAAAALGLPPEDARVSLLAAVLAERAGDDDAAQVAYERALARDPSLVVAQLGLAGVLAIHGREAERAVELAESARRTVGWTLESAEALGFALRAAGRPAEAVPAFRIALAKSDRGTGRTGERELELAETLAAAGERAEALARAKALVSLGRRAKPAPPWLERAQALRKRLRQQEPASAPAG